MFDDVGGKIQALAKIFFYICLVGGGLVFLFSLLKGAWIIVGISALFVISSFISCLPLYGFGILIEKAERIDWHLSELYSVYKKNLKQP